MEGLGGEEGVGPKIGMKKNAFFFSNFFFEAGFSQ